jgi:aspartyl-tRNA(Asn)/glutamyl-tRNA(Gln) amidotransferase subunit A
VRDTALALNVLAGPDPRDWRSRPADPRDYTIGLEDGVRGLRIGLSLDFGHVTADAEVRALVAAAAKRFEELGARVEDVGPLIEPLQNSFEPLWIGSFATRFRQIPTQLHGKLDPGFRAAAEKGLAVTLADYARAYEAKSKLARDLALWHEKFDLLLAPRRRRRHRRSRRPTIPTPFRVGPRAPRIRCLQSHRAAGRLDARRPHAGRPAGRFADHRSARADHLVLRAMRAYESASGWAWRSPKCWKRWPGSDAPIGR